MTTQVRRCLPRSAESTERSHRDGLKSTDRLEQPVRLSVRSLRLCGESQIRLQWPSVANEIEDECGARRKVDADLIAIKGIRQGLLVTLDEAGYWPALLAALEARLNDNPAFFRGGRVVLDVQSRTLTRAEIEEALAMCARHQVELWALLSTDATTESAAQQLGLVITLNWPPGTSSSSGGVEAERTARQEDRSPLEGLVVQRTLRSGQDLRHPGHIVIIGDVNVGAEVVAGGNIVVWGKVRGVVHAGALGDESSVVCALDLAPTQLRIAGHIARSPEERPEEPVPEMAFVQDGHIVAVPWPG